MPNRKNGSEALLDQFVNLLAAAVTTRIQAGGSPLPAAKATARRSSPRKGKKLDMSCRVAGCKNLSGGPRHGFMCPEHQKLSKKKQAAAREAWKATHAAPA